MNDRGKIPETLPQATCAGKIEVPTDKEMEALEAMKAIKELVRHLKKQYNECKNAEGYENSHEISRLEKEMAGLRVEWNKWEEKRQQAAKERMVLLGHEKED